MNNGQNNYPLPADNNKEEFYYAPTDQMPVEPMGQYPTDSQMMGQMPMDSQSMEQYPIDPRAMGQMPVEQYPMEPQYMDQYPMETQPEAAYQLNPEGEYVSNQMQVEVLDATGIIGQNKCPKCGSTDLSPVPGTSLLRCAFCRFESEEPKSELINRDIFSLDRVIIGAGANTISSSEEVITLKCSSCGSEVVINTALATQAVCHWCRNFISINSQIPNGANPDVLLPFYVTQDEAKYQIQNFVNKRKFFAHPKFVSNFNINNIRGVYLPYMVVDVNAKMALSGQGERNIREYKVGVGKNRKTVYDIEIYDVQRQYDIAIDNLSVESQLSRGNLNSSRETNNVINALMPFDVENSVPYQSDYLRGFTSERRDAEVSTLADKVHTQAQDVARIAANGSLEYYNRGVRWDYENFEIKGESWTAAYLPVWLYSYRDTGGLLHYVAVNGRRPAVMGSIPVNYSRLTMISVGIEAVVCCLLYMYSLVAGLQDTLTSYPALALALGPGYYFFVYNRYRNVRARHYYESTTGFEIRNYQPYDMLVGSKTRVKSGSMEDANNCNLRGAKATNIVDKTMKYLENSI